MHYYRTNRYVFSKHLKESVLIDVNVNTSERIVYFSVYGCHQLMNQSMINQLIFQLITINHMTSVLFSVHLSCAYISKNTAFLRTPT